MIGQRSHSEISTSFDRTQPSSSSFSLSNPSSSHASSHIPSLSTSSSSPLGVGSSTSHSTPSGSSSSKMLRSFSDFSRLRSSGSPLVESPSSSSSSPDIPTRHLPSSKISSTSLSPQSSNVIDVDDVNVESSFSWNSQRDAQLVEIYLRHYRDQTSLNGLKKSSWRYVTNFFNALYPNTPPLSQLQIKNRYQKLKQTWMLYRNIQNRSGVSWDAEECTLSMPAESWKELHREWAKRNVLSLVSVGMRRSNLRNWKSKPFPLFHMLSAIHEGKAFTGENIASFEKTFEEIETFLQSAVVDPSEIPNQELVVPEQQVPPSVGQRKATSKPQKSRRNLISLMQDHFAQQDKTASKVGEVVTYIAGLKSQFNLFNDYMAVIKKITQHEATVLFALPEVDRLLYLKSLLID